MATLTVLTKELVARIISNYPVGDVRAFHPLDGGLANSSMRVLTDTGTYVLSVCDEKNFDDIGMLCSILSYLEEKQFPTTRVIAAKSGAPCLEHDGKPVYLKRYIEGEVVNPLNPEQAGEVGTALARLHAIVPHASLPNRFSYGVETFAELEEQAADHDFFSWLFQQRPQILDACPDTLPRGFLHGDLFYDNMLFADGSLKAVLDFEEACAYYFVFDIGMTAIGCCVVDGRLSLELTAAMVAGYQQERTLEPVERTLLQRHVGYSAAATAFWRYRQYNVRNPDPAMKDHYRPMYDLARQVLGIDAGVFVKAVLA